MRALIIVNAYGSAETRQVRRIKQELDSLGVETVAERNNRFHAFIKNGNIAVDVDCDFCVYLDKDKYVPRILEKHGIRLFNSASAVELCDDKMTTHIALSNSGIAMPDTMPGLLCYDARSPLDKAALTKVERTLGFPIIAKLSFGSLGAGVFKADDRDELSAVAEKLKTYPHLFQRYIASSHGKDMRVIVIGGKVIGGIIRRSDGDFRSNIGLGGHAEKIDVPRDIADTAVKAANILGLDYCGIDFLLGDKPLLCEVNSNAYFDAFENATGINVAGAYAKHMINVMRNAR